MFSECIDSFYIFPIENGEILGSILIEDEEELFQDDCGASIRCSGPSCPTWKKPWWKRLGEWIGGKWNQLIDWFGGGNGGGNSGGTTPSPPSINPGFPGYNSSNNSNGIDDSGNNSGGQSGGGNTDHTFDLNDFYNQPFFKGQWGIVIILLENLIDQYDLLICTEDLHHLLYPCLSQQNGGNLPGDSDGLDVHAYNDLLLFLDSSNPCLADVINNYQSQNIDVGFEDGMLVCAVEEINEFDISDENLLELIKGKCDGSFECEEAIFECLDKLSSVQSSHNFTINSEFLQNSVFSEEGDFCNNVEQSIIDIFDDNFELEVDPDRVIDLEQSIEDCFGIQDEETGEFVDCSASNASFSVTLYARQPNANTRDTWAWGLLGPDVGHTFISVSSTENSHTNTLVFGFYPEENIVKPSSPASASAIQNNGGDKYTVSITYSLDCIHFNEILSQAIILSTTDYNLNDYNCTDYGVQILNNVLGATIPNSQGGWPGGSGNNPGDLGEDLRNKTDGLIDSAGGNAPMTNCN